MRKFLVAIGFVIFAVAVFAAVAYRALLLPHEGPKATTISLPLEFSMQLEKAEFLRSEDVTVHISLRNISNKTIGLEWSDFTMIDDQVVTIDFVILDTNNSQIYRFSQHRAYLQAVKEETLGPGEQLANVLVWNPGSGPEDVYSVKALTRPFALSVNGQTTWSNYLETPTITFTIK